ncbi:secreted RxLR effector protein 161-like [Phragmites australis]|uniref:secreted RxLR effector protein 161-like n=1 Tax=Phragmites australis TaxID=29695 RepID=UPI002D77F9C4|nr:secreted RxLR effector protein 161-like [Phragmites australis]
MMSMFHMSDLGLLTYYLSIEVSQGERSIMLYQSAYASKLLERSGMEGCNPCHAPLEERLKLSKASTTPAVDVTHYRSIVGGLRYLVHTWTDIAFVVGYVSRYMEDPREDHYAMVKHLLHYVAGTHGYGVVYKKEGGAALVLIGYSDSDMAGDLDGCKSTIGVLFLLGHSPISQQSQKQRVVALSTCEAEYIATAIAAC